MSKNTDEILGHADDNDGIEEYDNPLPDWWLGMFFLSIVFAVGYTLDYHALSDRSQVARYDAEMALAAERWPQQDAPSELAFDEATVAAGEEIFGQTCASCHGAELTGGIGPSLVDAEWIHGNAPEQVVKTITEGVSAKGMPAWGPVLGPDKVAKVAAFVLHESGGAAPSGDGPADAVEAQGDDGSADVGSAAPDEVPPSLDPNVPVDDGLASAEVGEAMDPIAAGAQVFAQNCAACHGAEMTGLVGPNLVDDEWIHGGELEEIVSTIKNGVPDKGMMSWGPILGDEKIDQVARYVYAKSHPE